MQVEDAPSLTAARGWGLQEGSVSERQEVAANQAYQRDNQPKLSVP